MQSPVARDPEEGLVDVNLCEVEEHVLLPEHRIFGRDDLTRENHSQWDGITPLVETCRGQCERPGVARDGEAVTDEPVVLVAGNLLRLVGEEAGDERCVDDLAHFVLPL